MSWPGMLENVFHVGLSVVFLSIFVVAAEFLSRYSTFTNW